MFGEQSAQASLTRIEEEVRRFWRRHRVPDAARAARQDGPTCAIYQQPLVVAGESWGDQVRLLAATDLLARYHTMQSDAVYRQTGWACHGLPVEVAVERTLGLEASDYDLAQFNADCRAAAIEGMRQAEALAEWLGAWLDPTSVYATLDPKAIGLVWGALRRLWDAGRFRHQRQVAPVCPRCATPLSEAETTRRAIEVEAPSIWMCLPWNGEPDAYLLTWTPTPWTLVGMVALAAHPDASYVLVELAAQEDQPPVRLVLAEAALDRTQTGPCRLVRRLGGKSLRETRYHPPFTFLPFPEGSGRVVLSEAVPLEQGTGLLSVTPNFDGASLMVAQAHGLPVPDLVDDGGKLNDAVTPWRGLSPFEGEPLLVEDLRTRGLLFQEETGTKVRALCPYCETPLLPQAQDVWLVETASGPWMVGRQRAWGAPLPVWVCCGCGEQDCVAGLDDLAHRTGLGVDQIDPHRPAVDGLTFPCEVCGGTMRRVGPVVDAGFEAAVLPWAIAPQSGPADRPAVHFSLPETRRSVGSVKRAQQTLAVGLGDRHIGWLGDLTEMTALLHSSLAWEQALALPEDKVIVRDLDRTTPADALRWAVYFDTTPDQAEHGFLQPLWQFVMPPTIPAPGTEEEAGPVPPSPSLPRAQRPGGSERGSRDEFLDRWLVARLHQTTGAVTAALDTCGLDRAAKELAGLVNDFAWYVPLRPGSGGEALETLSRLLAPFVPHVAEAIHRQVVGRGGDSVHLADWPTLDPTRVDGKLLADVTLVRRLAALGRAARIQAGVEPDQPLRRALVGFPGEGAAEPAPFGMLLAEQLAVSRVKIIPDVAAQVSWHLALKPGRAAERGITPTQIDAALEALDQGTATALVSQFWNGLSAGLDVSGQAVTLLPDEVSVSVQAPPGCAAAADAGHLVVLEMG
jgi:isoleucyl-tRNA synthetase